MQKIAAGNWKMNGTQESLGEIEALGRAETGSGITVLICPPATLLSRAVDAASGTSVAIGGQDCHIAESGAHTGDVSAAMIADAGATFVIVGHSERRADHGESDETVAAKASAAAAAGLTPIICVGETLEERESGKTLDVVGAQIDGSVPSDLSDFVVAYEPVWAIGTGKVPTLEQIGEVHDFIRDRLGARGAETPLLYGGSVKPGNAAEIFAVSNVNGALVGGASLKASDFGGIVSALDAADG